MRSMNFFEPKLLASKNIIFGGQDTLCNTFSNEMMKEFEMSVFSKVKFFVGLQVY